MRSLRALVFDMDGTLLRSVATILDAYAATVRTVAGRPCTPEEVTAHFGVGPGSPLLSALLGNHCGPAELACYHDQLRARSGAALPYPGIERMVARAAASVPVAVYTGTDRFAAELLLGNAGLLRYVSVLVCGDEVTRPKPDPEGLLTACGRLGVAPEQAAYVGDSVFDVRAAAAGGLLAIAVRWGHQFDGAAPADVVLDSPDDLVALLPAGRARAST